MNLKKIGLGLLFTSVVVLAGCSKGNDNSAQTMALAECLTSKGAIFYGTERCPHCQAQKAAFGAAMEKVTYVDCDKEADRCKLAGIQGYPTRVFTDGTRAEGTQELTALAEKTACEYNNESSETATETATEDTATTN